MINMKRQRTDIKKTIKKRIELRHQHLAFIEKKGEKRMVAPISVELIKKKPVRVELVNDKPMNEIDKRKEELDKRREEISKGMNERDLLRIYGTTQKLFKIVYQKKVFVDYDVVICIPSYDRYIKVKRLISQFYEQPTKYTFKIVLLNDGTAGNEYNRLIKKFPEIFYLKNSLPNGKILHWYCYNQMWGFLKNIQCHAVLQMDDDFILSNNFLDTIVDLFFNIKEKNGNVMAIAPHLWSFRKRTIREGWWQSKIFVDGIALIDDAVIKYMKYEMQPVDAIAVNKVGVPVRAWTQISAAIKNMGGIIYRTPNSLVYHDGNDDSKLHVDARKGGKGGVYTQKYIGKL